MTCVFSSVYKSKSAVIEYFVNIEQNGVENSDFFSTFVLELAPV